MRHPPKRIVCLTEETVETLYLLEEQDRIVGVSGYAVRPPKVRREKPRISAFISANIPKILDLNPDLVLAFSDLQADIVGDLIREGIEVHAFNQRDINGILDMIYTLGAILDVQDKAEKLVILLRNRIENVKIEASKFRRKRVYFEEWNDPLISGIRWVSELIEIAGGEDIFKDLSFQKAAKNRIVSEDAVVKKNPEIIFASWCGKKVQQGVISRRKGWDSIDAISKGNIFEIKSPIILQPGPAALTDGLDAMVRFIQS